MSAHPQFQVLSKGDLEEALYEAIERALPHIIADLDLPGEQPKVWFSTREAMAYLSFSKSTLQRYRDEGLLPYHQSETGAIRYRRRDLDAVLNERSVGGSGRRNI